MNNIFSNLSQICDVAVDIELKNYTSFKVGGKCDYLCAPTTTEQIVSIVKVCKQVGIPYVFWGNGSNMLVSDNGYRGVCIVLSKNYAYISCEQNMITSTSGVNLAKLCWEAQKQGLSGLEFAYGIPGNVGGAVYMNAGAYGGEMKDVLHSVTYLDEDEKIVTKKVDELELSYRHSFFTDKSLCILSATFDLCAGDKEQIKELMEQTMQKRVNKQPLEYPSAGSTFKRPDGYFASALIEECGLKGHRIGGAMVSEKHSGFVINYDNASCQDILELISHIKQTVLSHKGVELECEVKPLM